jgi:hypothetical protein
VEEVWAWPQYAGVSHREKAFFWRFEKRCETPVQRDRVHAWDGVAAAAGMDDKALPHPPKTILSRSMYHDG